MVVTNVVNANAGQIKLSADRIAEGKIAGVFKCLERYERRADKALIMACGEHKPPFNEVGKMAAVIDIRTLLNWAKRTSDGKEALKAFWSKFDSLKNEHKEKLVTAKGDQKQEDIEILKGEQSVFGDVDKILF